jgi:biotin transport system substrate-specific component
MPTAASTSRFPMVSEFASTLPGRMTIAVGAIASVAAAAHVALPLPFTPVPLTLQPLAVLGVGLALGPVEGFCAMLAYLAAGAAGLPVFSPTGPGGALQLFGATGGFLMAYPLVAAIAGGLVRLFPSRTPRFTAAAVACTVATLVLFACGAGWLMLAGHLSLRQAWVAGVLPFLPGEVVKIAVASGVCSSLYPSKRSSTSV